MSDVKQDGGPAFPRPYVTDEASSPDARYKQAQEGMSLRDYYIGQALSGLMTTLRGSSDATKEQRTQVFDKWAPLLCEIADAVLKAREK